MNDYSFHLHQENESRLLLKKELKTKSRLLKTLLRNKIIFRCIID